jgi:hypothetical protein
VRRQDRCARGQRGGMRDDGDVPPITHSPLLALRPAAPVGDRATPTNPSPNCGADLPGRPLPALRAYHLIAMPACLAFLACGHRERRDLPLVARHAPISGQPPGRSRAQDRILLPRDRRACLRSGRSAAGRLSPVFAALPRPPPRYWSCVRLPATLSPVGCPRHVCSMACEAVCLSAPSSPSLPCPASSLG